MNTQQSFTYTITSATSDPTGASAEDVTINIGPLKENYDELLKVNVGVERWK